MPFITVAVTSALAIVLGVSAVTKLGSVQQTGRALRGFGVADDALVRWGARLLAPVELLLAVGLLIAPAPLFSVGAVLAAMLMLLFTLVVVRAVRRGDRVECNCFGSVGAEAVGRSTVVRNVVLLAGAMFIALVARNGAFYGAAGFAPAEWALFFALIAASLGALLVATTVRNRSSAAVQSTDVPAQRDGAEWPTPSLEVTNSRGRSVELTAIVTERPVLLVLLSAECTPCTEIAADLPEWQRRFEGAVEVAVITSAAPEIFAARYPDLQLPTYYGYRALVAAGGIQGVPSALLFSTSRTVAAGPAQGSIEVRELAEAVMSVVHGGGAPVLLQKAS